jgi:hypothetical protein
MSVTRWLGRAVVPILASRPVGGRTRRVRPFLAALLLTLGAAGVTASPALAQAKARSTIKCISSSELAVTWTFSEFPATGENNIKEEIKLDGAIVYKAVFTFTGPSATNAVTIPISPGHHAITVFAHWNGNGVKGQSDHLFKNGIECSKPGVAAPLTPGYWKNHLTEGSPNTQQFLPQSIGNYKVETTEQATAIFTAMNCGSALSSSQNAIGCLAGHLLATELNLAHGSEVCISATVAKANSWLEGNTEDGVPGIVYEGPSVSYTLTQAQREEAIALKNPLDIYNNGGGC